MTLINKIDGILITMQVADNHVLYIMLSADGTINRKGDGSPNCSDNDLYIGRTTDQIFEELKLSIPADIDKYLEKTFDDPHKKGRNCDLKIMIKGADIETGVQFLYGELSQGPPPEYRTLVIKAVELTNPWHRKQKSISGNETKPWWKFW